MTIPEAPQPVSQASGMRRGGEIPILGVGEPIRVVALARNVIRLYGFGEKRIWIVFTGLRPGEKLYEPRTARRRRDNHAYAHPKLRTA